MCWWDRAEEQLKAGRCLVGFALPGPAFFLWASTFTSPQVPKQQFLGLLWVISWRNSKQEAGQRQKKLQVPGHLAQEPWLVNVPGGPCVSCSEAPNLGGHRSSCRSNSSRQLCHFKWYFYFFISLESSSKNWDGEKWAGKQKWVLERTMEEMFILKCKGRKLSPPSLPSPIIFFPQEEKLHFPASSIHE